MSASSDEIMEEVISCNVCVDKIDSMSHITPNERSQLLHKCLSQGVEVLDIVIHHMENSPEDNVLFALQCASDTLHNAKRHLDE